MRTGRRSEVVLAAGVVVFVSLAIAGAVILSVRLLGGNDSKNPRYRFNASFQYEMTLASRIESPFGSSNEIRTGCTNAFRAAKDRPVKTDRSEAVDGCVYEAIAIYN